MFDKQDIADIQRYSAGLSESEVLDIFGMDMDSLDFGEKLIFIKAFKKGRAMGKAKAIDALFVGMEGNDAVKGALSYLVRMAEEWPGEGKQTGNTELGAILKSIDK